MAYPEAIARLPITGELDALCGELRSSPSRFLVLTAETGAGKSTAVPFALLAHFKKHILMLEPRRLAVLAVASRVAELLGEETGGTAGYVMHLERKTSPQTRFTVMTESILTRKLQADPSLEGVDVVVIDEFHERSIHADLALAFLKETMELRDDLFVIVMSATMDADAVAAYLGTEGEPAPIHKVAGRLFPVDICYEAALSPAEAVRRELGRVEKGSILVFLPGIADIRRCEADIRRTQAERKDADAELLVLHSSAPLQEQRKALRPAQAGRRIILSSAIAETSLTVPDVVTVIDSGLSRLNRLHVASGMEKLVTERESLFSAQQRAGRAGRTQAGRCIRLWAEHERLPERTPPEILRTDIVPLVLECAEWGVSERGKLHWLDAPPATAWESALELLARLGCMEGGHITERGRAALLLGMHPRLACVALDGGIDEAIAASPFADAAPALQKRYREDLVRRLRSCGHVRTQAAIPLLSGFPDRLARLADDSQCYRFPSGRLAVLPAEEAEKASLPRWIIAPEADAGERTGRIYRWEAVSEEAIADFLAAHSRTESKAEFTGSSGSLKKTTCTYYGKILLSSRTDRADKADFAEAVCREVRAKGLDWLPLSAQSRSLLVRAAFYQSHGGRQDGTPQEDVSDWLPPFLTDNRLTEEAVYQALRYRLHGDEVDRAVPERLAMPNGKSFRLTYEKSTASGEVQVRPVLEIIIQQIFGCFETPRILGVPVLLRLLSPARRPLQVTDDLAHFWQNTWPDICKEMKGRYPKHNWDYREPK